MNRDAPLQSKHADCCKPGTAKIFFQSIIKFAVIECNRLRRLALTNGGNQRGRFMSQQIRMSEINAHGVDRKQTIASALICGAVALAFFSNGAKADEGGVSFWIPGFFGSLAAAPLQPGWSLTSFYYHTTVSAGSDVARAREIRIGRIPVNLTANLNASLDARADLGIVMPLYTFATPVFGGQLTVGAIGLYGRESTSLAGSVTGALATPLGTLPFSRFDTISDSVSGFGDVLPIATLRWNNGVHNWMTYITG